MTGSIQPETMDTEDRAFRPSSYTPLNPVPDAVPAHAPVEKNALYYARIGASSLGLFGAFVALSIWIAPDISNDLIWTAPVLACLFGGAMFGVDEKQRTARGLLLAGMVASAYASPLMRGWVAGGDAVMRAQAVIGLTGTAAIAVGDFTLAWAVVCAAVGYACIASLCLAGGGGIVLPSLFGLQIGGALFARFRTQARRATDRNAAEDFSLGNIELPGMDLLTGAASRKLFDEELNLAFEGDPGTNVAVLLIDTDHFKAFNTKHGYQAGDRCLAAMARTMQQQLRADVDLLARYRGSEFAVLLPGADLGDAARVAERIRRAVEDLSIPHGDSESAILTVSIGFSAAPRALSRPERLVNAADASLYAAKQAGRNRIAPQLVRPGMQSDY